MRKPRPTTCEANPLAPPDKVRLGLSIIQDVRGGVRYEKVELRWEQLMQDDVFVLAMLDLRNRVLRG